MCSLRCHSIFYDLTYPSKMKSFFFILSEMEDNFFTWKWTFTHPSIYLSLENCYWRIVGEQPERKGMNLNIPNPGVI